MLDTIDTPALVIDLDIVERNITRMQEYCNDHDLRFRPHVKTHKLPQLARRQIEAGAVGLCCQKLGEAEVMISAGFTDILIPYNIVGPIKIAHLLALSEKARVAVAADSLYVVEGIASAARQRGLTIPIFVECDTGHHRAGVQSPAAALQLASAIVHADGAEFAGLLTYPTHPTGTHEFMAEATRLFAAAHLPIPVISGGGTPAGQHAHEVSEVTEHRAGTYIYGDVNTVAAGVSTWDDCALRILCTVVSRPTEERAILDGGSKTFSSDMASPNSLSKGYGRIMEYPNAVIAGFSEEHGHVDVSASAKRPAIGERVTVVPNHVCVAVNLHDKVYVTRGGVLQDCWPIAARGTVQ